MIRLNNIHALDHFKRNTAEFRERLKQTGEPEVLTVDGRPELVIQSAEAFQKLLDRLEEVETELGIRRGLADVEAGRVYSVEEVFDELRQRASEAKAKRRRRA